MMMSILQLSAILLATFCLSGNALPVEKSSPKVATGWSDKAHTEKSKLIGDGLKSNVDKIHKTDTGTIIKPEESKNDEIPIYIQTPDASDLGVPVDHIPVQESIVKSLIADHTDIEKIEFTDLGKSEKNLIPANDQADKAIATDSKRSDVDKVQIKLGTSFEAIKSDASSVSPITTQSPESLESQTELPKSDLDTLASDKTSSSSSSSSSSPDSSSPSPDSSSPSPDSSSSSNLPISQEKEKIVSLNETDDQSSQSLFYLTSITTTFAPLLASKIDKIPIISGKGPALDSIKSQSSPPSVNTDLNQSKSSSSQTVPPPPISITSVPLYSSNDNNNKNIDDQKLTTIVDYKVTPKPGKLSGDKLTYSSVDTEVLSSSTGKGNQIKTDDGGDKIGIKQNSPPASSSASPSKSFVTSVHPVHHHQKTSPSSSPSSQPISLSSSSLASSSQSSSNTFTTTTATPSSSIRYQFYESSSSKDISDLISDPVDQATKLLIDLEEQVELYLKSEKHEELVTTSVPLSYGVNSEAENIEKQGATQIQSMIDEVNRVAQNVETVISELVSNRRYMTAAMFRSLLNYLRRVRISLERLQTRMQVLGVPGAGTGPTSSTPGDVIAGVSPPTTITATYLDQIRDRIFRITEEIRTLISRMRITLSPSSSPSPLLM